MIKMVLFDFDAVVFDSMDVRSDGAREGESHGVDNQKYLKDILVKTAHKDYYFGERYELNK